MADCDEMGRNERELRLARINGTLGLFLLSFGIVVVIAMAFTPTLVGKLTNLVAGAIIGLIGGVMIYFSRRRT